MTSAESKHGPKLLPSNVIPIKMFVLYFLFKSVNEVSKLQILSVSINITLRLRTLNSNKVLGSAKQSGVFCVQLRPHCLNNVTTGTWHICASFELGNFPYYKGHQFLAPVFFIIVFNYLLGK